MLLHGIHKTIERSMVETPFLPFWWRTARWRKRELANDSANWFKATILRRKHLTQKKESNGEPVAVRRNLCADAGIWLFDDVTGELLERDPTPPGVQTFGSETASGEHAQ